MGQQRGANFSVMLGFETTYGTASSTGFVLPVNSFTPNPGQTINKADTLRGNRNPVQPFRGNRNVQCSLVVPIDSICMIYWLVAMFGDPTSTGAGPYVHEFKIGSSQPSFTLEGAFTDLTTDRYIRLLGCKVQSFNIQFGGDGELVASIVIFGAEDSWQTSAFDGSPTSPSLARINNFDGAVAEGGASSSIITSVSVAVDFGLDTSDENITIGSSGIRTSLPEGIVGVGGNVVALFDDDGYTLLAKGIAKTESSLKITNTASASSVFELEMQELEYGRSAPDVPNPGGVRVSQNFEAFYDDGSEASALVARVTNSTASYDLV